MGKPWIKYSAKPTLGDDIFCAVAQPWRAFNKRDYSADKSRRDLQCKT